MIVVVDYGMGNLGSILNMLKKIGVGAVVSSCIDDIERASKLILPGVGAFDNGMRSIRERGLQDILDRKVLEDKIPVLGICLGMQLLGRGSEEGSLPGLGWIDAETVRFRFDNEHASLKIPHMGWNSVRVVKESPLFREAHGDERFYFVHSYRLVCNDSKDVLTETTYGSDFTSAVAKGNIMGVQFHPEKSHKFGMKLLKNFAECS